jgi:hypothetical protein
MVEGNTSGRDIASARTTRRGQRPRERNAERGAEDSQFLGLNQLVFRIGLNFVDMNRSAFNHGSRADRPTIEPHRMSLHELSLHELSLHELSLHEFQIGRLEAVDRNVLADVALQTKDTCLVRAAQQCRRLDQRHEYRLKIEGHAGHHRKAGVH